MSFRDLLPPGAASQMALARHVAQLVINERPHARPEWRYSGVGGLLSKHGVYFGGRELPDRWGHVAGSEGRCHHNSIVAAEREPELRYFTGLYMVGFNALPHSWCIDADSNVVEVTFPTRLRGSAYAGLMDEFQRATSVPWLPPAHWNYVGVEYDTAFVRSYLQARGLPILDPFGLQTTPRGLAVYSHDEELPMWTTPYSPAGFPITDMPPEVKEQLAKALGRP